jgi:hypothetical protein
MTTNEELQQQLDTMRHEMAQLRQQLSSAVAATDTGEGGSGEGEHRVLSRRNLLRAAPIAAIGGAVAAMSASPAAAAVGGPVLLGKSNSAPGATTSIAGGATGVPAVGVNGGVVADSLGVGDPDFDGVEIGVADGPAVIYAHGEDKFAAQFVAFVAGYQAAGGHDVVGVNSTGPGNGLTVNASDKFFGNPDGSIGHYTSDAIVANADSGTGLAVTGDDGHAITAATTSTTTSTDAVTIDYAGTSRALYAQSHNPTNINGTVTGVNEGHGIGVWGEQRNDTGSGFGVVGVGGAQGRGARLSGGAAAAQMLPSTAATHPTTGKAGDFFVDAAVRLWFCQKASSGAVAAVWKQIA